MLYDLTTGKESGEPAHPLGPDMEMMRGRASSPVDRWLGQWSSDVNVRGLLPYFYPGGYPPLPDPKI